MPDSAEPESVPVTPAHYKFVFKNYFLTNYIYFYDFPLNWWMLNVEAAISLLSSGPGEQCHGDELFRSRSHLWSVSSLFWYEFLASSK